MTKKEFKELTSYHQYRGGGRENGLNALFFGWSMGVVDGEPYRGFSHCVWARAVNATKAELEKVLYDFITGKIEDTEYYIQLIVVQNDKQRFKVPISGNGLNSLIKRY